MGGMEGLEQEGRANTSFGVHVRAGEFLRGELLKKDMNKFPPFHICVCFICLSIQYSLDASTDA